MIIVNATDIQNNFDHYIQSVQQGDEIIILKNGKEVARLVPCEYKSPFLTDSLTCVLKNDNNDRAFHADKKSSWSLD